MDISIKDFLTLSVGSGENDFTMSRGSFTYKQKITGRSDLEKVSEKPLDGGFLLEFADRKSAEKHYLSVTETGGLIRISYCDGKAGT